MSFFSFFSRKKRPPEAPGNDNVVPDPVMETVPPAEEFSEELLERQTTLLRMQRDAARRTAEKIDAIESEIAKDILKAKPVVDESPQAASESDQGKPPAEETSSTDPFATTILRIDRETLLMLREPKAD